MKDFSLQMGHVLAIAQQHFMQMWTQVNAKIVLKIVYNAPTQILVINAHQINIYFKEFVMHNALVEHYPNNNKLIMRLF